METLMRDNKSTLAPMADRNFWEIRNADSNVAEIYIYDAIGEDWAGNGISAIKFIEQINNIKASHIELHVNSPGGSVFDGQAIYNALVRHPAVITTYVDGLAASIASVIALAGDRVVMASNSLFMIHNPMSSVAGYASDMRKMADVLDKIKESILSVYQKRTALNVDELATAMDNETWYTASEALDAGFANELSDAMPIAAKFDLAAYGYKHNPLVSNEIDPEQDDEQDDSATDGASVEVVSDGTLETEQLTDVVDEPKFIDGVGFHTFKQKGDYVTS